jgi:hypothetical protein
MPALPASLALNSISGEIAASPLNSDYAAIQTAVNALIAILSNGVLDGDPMVWDGVNAKWIAASTLAAGRPRAPRVVTSTMAGGPPASPVDQDIWVATAVDANGTRWAFQYNAGSASTFKWEFIGGPPVRSLVDTDESSVTVGAWFDLATVGPTVALARAGDYLTDFGADLYNSTNANGLGVLGVAEGAVAPDTPVSNFFLGGINFDGMWTGRNRHNGIAAATTLRLRYWNSTAASTLHAVHRFLHVLPVRIS